MTEPEILRDLLDRRYGVQAAALHSLRLQPGNSGLRVYYVEGAKYKKGMVDQRWVLRAWPPEGLDEDLNAHASVLAFLEDEGYPAPRLQRTTDGLPVARHDGWQAMLMDYVGGVAPEYSARDLRLLGGAIGGLHALDATAALESEPPVRTARWNPQQRRSLAMEKLQSVAEQVPRELRDQHSALVMALETTECGPELPVRIIHTDCYPGNAVFNADGDVVLLNWSSAGLGPAVIDIGRALLTCSTALPWAPELGPNEARITALVEGYSQKRLLAPVEIDSLLHAVRFVPAVMGAITFVAAMTGDTGEEQWKLWWSRYCASQPIAELAREHFEACTRTQVALS